MLIKCEQKKFSAGSLLALIGKFLHSLFARIALHVQVNKMPIKYIFHRVKTVRSGGTSRNESIKWIKLNSITDD